MTYWAQALSKAKEDAKASGKISGDTDLAEKTSEILAAAEFPEVQRGAINHWINGRNPPSVPAFIAVCMALGISPSDALARGHRKLVGIKQAPKGNAARVMSVIDSMDETDLGRAADILNAAFPQKQIEKRRKS